MANIDFPALIADSVQAAKLEAGRTWNKLKPFAEHEFTQFAENAAFLAKLRADGTIDEDEFKARMNLQRLALNNTLLAIKGIGAVTAQNIVNAVLGLVGNAVVKAFNIALPF